MTEQDQALKIANMWLDFQMNPLTQMVPGDPDCDACVLARQYIRATDRLSQSIAVSELLELLRDHYWDSLSAQKELILKHVCGALEHRTPRPVRAGEKLKEGQAVLVKDGIAFSSHRNTDRASPTKET